MRFLRKPFSAAYAAGGASLVAYAAKAESPLQVVLDGRAAAESTNMTEAGLSALMVSGGNSVLTGAGLLGIILGSGGLMTVYRGHSDADDSKVRAGWMMTAIGGCVTVPAIVAAIVPYLMGV